jgi:Fe-S cluster biogenesis protein NfuA
MKYSGPGGWRMSKEGQILAVLEQIRPALQADGGDVEFIGFDEGDGIVHLRLMGACESCPISMLTLKEGIEKRIRNSVPEVTEVLAI